ncbi:MAG: amidohydrolase family protein, partial [Clostridiaceae bacterium]|nr:amidohydrolase family protein [Clostridiaceae bacterium]
RWLGCERVLFGSDMPGASFLISYGQVEDAALPEADKARIYRDNARRIIPGV